MFSCVGKLKRIISLLYVVARGFLVILGGGVLC